MRADSGRRWRANRPFRTLSLCAVILLLLFYFLFPTSRIRPADSHCASSARNQTLGFGAIYVLTEDTTTWRVQGLHQAAKLAGLRLTIPVQRRPSDQQLNAYLEGDEAEHVLDEIRAVLNYISLLETFIKAGHETALFVEDDVDFSINIESQMGSISQTVLEQTSPANEQERAGMTNVNLEEHLLEDPYGNHGWDVFWIGHFGIEYTTNSQTWTYTDPHALPWDHLTSAFNNYYETQADVEAQSQEQPQHIIHSVAPMATYAFALTRGAAQKLVSKLRNERAQKFDYALHRHCKGLDLTCMAPVPGVMHHHKVAGEKSINVAGTQNDGKYDLEWWRNQHKYTYNIEWSARCNAAGVGERLGNRWQCMPGRYDKNI